MSGGRFGYMDATVKTEIFGYNDKPKNVFEDIEISELIWDVFDLIHDFDWYKSGDTGEEDYLKSKIAFKAKWLNSSFDERVKNTIDKSLDKTREELYKTYGIKCK